MIKVNYYETLGIHKPATTQEIREAYRRSSKEHHPDKGGNPDDFQAIKEAYETLIDQEKRAVYDYFDGQSLDEIREVVIQVFKAALASGTEDIKAGITGATRDIQRKIKDEIRGIYSHIRSHEKVLKRIRRAPAGMDFLGDDIRRVIQNLRDQKAEADRRLNLLNPAKRFLIEKYEFRGEGSGVSGFLNAEWIRGGW